jgi:hypothetical protein
MKDNGASKQPYPRIPGVTRRMVRVHAAQMFRDVLRSRPLTSHEWRLVEADLARRLESVGW